MLFWKMFWIASFMQGHMRITMLGSILMLLLSPALGVIALLFHIMIHAHHIYSAKQELKEETFIKWCWNKRIG